MDKENSKKPAVAIAGAGDVAKFFVEELLADGRYRVVVLSRAERDWFIRPGVEMHVTDYTHESTLTILNTTSPIALFSFIHSDWPDFYLGVHNALLSACAASRTCHRLIPSEYGSNVSDFPDLPRFYGPTHGMFRETLRQRAAEMGVSWALVNGGWFMDYFVPADRSYMKPLPGVWPIDLEQGTAVVLGTGEEAIGWTAARDVAKALVRLVEAEDLEEHIYVLGENNTWNAAIAKLEAFHNRKFSRMHKSREQIEKDLHDRTASNDADGLLKVSQMEEWNVTGASALPWDVVLRQRRKYFDGIKFRGIEELLQDAQRSEGIV